MYLYDTLIATNLISSNLAMLTRTKYLSKDIFVVQYEFSHDLLQSRILNFYGF